MSTFSSHQDRMLEIQSVSKSYETPQGPLAVLTEVNLSLAAGKTMALMGESGSGKSTLLHLIAGLDDFNAGRISVENVDIGALSDTQRAQLRCSSIGIVFQQFNLIPSLKIGDNLAFQARLAGRFDKDWQVELTHRLGLDELLDRYPEQLSGGQQQRVAIGRCFASRPPLLLADEPTGNLDEATAKEVLGLALDLVERTGCCFLMATHSSTLASYLDAKTTLKGGRLA